MVRGRKQRHLLEKRNPLDFGILEPGDIILVANPHDNWLERALLFWSHAALYTGLDDAHAFIDAVNLPVRASERRAATDWQRVRLTSKAMFETYVDLLVLRPRIELERRQAAVAFALKRVGKPFPRHFLPSFLSKRDTSEYTCTSLVWHSYMTQGLDLSPRWPLRALMPWPSALARLSSCAHVGRATRYRPLAARGPTLWLAVSRLYFRYVLGCDIITNVRGPARCDP